MQSSDEERLLALPPAPPVPLWGYLCHKMNFTCDVGEVQERRRGKGRRTVVNWQGGCRYWIDDPECGNCCKRNEKEHTCEEVGRMIGLSRQSVIRAENAARKKLYVLLIGWSDMADNAANSVHGARKRV
jgi:hypothetical protein